MTRPNHEFDAYQSIIQKLDGFIRKYYKNQLLKGLILVAAIFLASLIVVSVLEHYGRFGTTVRTLLFYIFLSLNAAVLIRYIIIPGARLFRLGPVISYEEASRIVGRHFPEVQDKLLNTLQLYRQAQEQAHPASRALIHASIDQRSRQLSPVPFSLAIRLGENKRYLKYALAPLVILLFLLIRLPDAIVGSTTRIVDHRNFYEAEAPFSFKLLADSLRTLRNEDFPVQLRMEGESLPQDVYIAYDGQQYRMNQQGPDRFRFVLNNLQEAITFRFYANGFASRPYNLEVLPVPMLRGFSVALDYPEYTGREDETLHNVGDLSVPAGTQAQWRLQLENTRRVMASFHDTTYQLQARNDELRFSRTFMKSNTYFLLAANEYVRSRDSIRYRVSVTPDAYPSVVVAEEQDSSQTLQRYFSGKASDDYGISQAQFVYQVQRDGAQKPEAAQTVRLQIEGGQLTPIFHLFDMSRLDLGPGDEVTYYFRVWDNDAIHGRKSARSQTFRYHAPTTEELAEKTEATSQQVQQAMQSAAEEASQLQREMEETRQRLLEKRNFNWQDQKQVENLLRRQKQLEETVQKLQQQYERSTQQQQQFGAMEQQQAEQHRELQKMMEDMMNPELKKMMERIQELMQKNRKQAVEKQLGQMKEENKSLEQNIRQMEQLYKQLEVEDQLRKNIEELEKLAQKQKELAKDGKGPQEDDPSQDQEDTDASKDAPDDAEYKTNQEEDANSLTGDEESTDEDEAPENVIDKESEPQENESTEDQDSGDTPSEEKDPQGDTSGDQERQKALNEQFEKLREQIDKMEEQNKELNKPFDMPSTEEEQQAIEQNMRKALEQMQKGNTQQSRQQQNKAGAQMQELAAQMRKMQSQMKKKAIQLNMRALRQLLENLVYLSKEQERLMASFRETRNYNPRYVALRQEQFKIKQDAQMVEDSLRSLAERVSMIKPYITREMDEVNHFMKQSIEDLDVRKTGSALKNQQYVMTHVNNLALLLSEVLDNMQQQMSAMMSGQQMMQRPMQSQSGQSGQDGQKRQKQLEQLRKKQQALQKQMGQLSEKAQQRAEQHKKGEEGGQSGQGDGMSEDMARMAAQQEALRQQLRQMREQAEEQGQGAGGDLQKIQEEMDQTEEDLLNKKITRETLRRQERIIEQLLDAEKAERQREIDPKRESERARDYQREDPPSLEEYKAQKMKELELLRTLPPALNSYYKERVMKYFDRMKQ